MDPDHSNKKKIDLTPLPWSSSMPSPSSSSSSMVRSMYGGGFHRWAGCPCSGCKAGGACNTSSSGGNGAHPHGRHGRVPACTAPCPSTSRTGPPMPRRVLIVGPSLTSSMTSSLTYNSGGMATSHAAERASISSRPSHWARLYFSFRNMY